MVKDPGPFKEPRPLIKQTPAREIVEAVFPTYPGDRTLTIADTFTAKWISEDAITFVLHNRRDYLDSWFGASLERVVICRHRDWKRACPECLKHKVETLENFMDGNPALRKEPDKL